MSDLQDVMDFFTIDDGNEMGNFQSTGYETAGKAVYRCDVTLDDINACRRVISAAMSGQPTADASPASTDQGEQAFWDMAACAALQGALARQFDTPYRQAEECANYAEALLDARRERIAHDRRTAQEGGGE